MANGTAGQDHRMHTLIHDRMVRSTPSRPLADAHIAIRDQLLCFVEVLTVLNFQRSARQFTIGLRGVNVATKERGVLLIVQRERVGLDVNRPAVLITIIERPKR